jgi:hypothetical protein
MMMIVNESIKQGMINFSLGFKPAETFQSQTVVKVLYLMTNKENSTYHQ